MKKLFGISLLSLTASLMGAEDDWSLNHSFSMWGEYVHMRRALTHNNDLILDNLNQVANRCNVCVPTELCDTKKVINKFNFEPGFRVGAAYMTRRTTLEATYLLMREWTGTCSATVPGGLFFSEGHPFLLNDYANADHAAVRYQTHFENGEINYFRYVSPKKENFISCAWLLGLRYICLWEEIDLAYTTYTTDSTSNYNIKAHNHFGAVQIGGAIEWIPIKHLSWDFVIKVGMGYDWAKQRTLVRDYNNTVVVHHFEASDTRFPPFIADGAMTLGYQLFNWLNLHVGYQLIYLNGLALAPNQIHKGPKYPHHVAIDGEAMVYGLFAGLNLSF